MGWSRIENNRAEWDLGSDGVGYSVSDIGWGMTGLDKLGAGDRIFPRLQDGSGWLEHKVAGQHRRAVQKHIYNKAGVDRLGYHYER